MATPAGGEPIILASRSPRRRALLEAAGWVVSVRPADVDESRLAGETPEACVLRLARCKARAVSDLGIVLGADTTVVVADHMLEKPPDALAAAAMLRQLSGRRHEVLTGLCLRDTRRGLEAVAVETTRVWFSSLTPSEIADYVATAEPLDKAGAYAIQGIAARFIPRIEGSYSNVVGLPLARVWELWQQLATPPAD